LPWPRGLQAPGGGRTRSGVGVDVPAKKRRAQGRSTPGKEWNQVLKERGPGQGEITLSEAGAGWLQAEEEVGSSQGGRDQPPPAYPGGVGAGAWVQDERRWYEVWSLARWHAVWVS
jgi:hypothetical protein